MSEIRQVLHALNAISYQLMYMEQRIINLERLMRKPLSELLYEDDETESDDSTESAPPTFRHSER